MTLRKDGKVWPEWRKETREYYLDVRSQRPFWGGFQWLGKHRFGYTSTATILKLTGCV